MRVVLVLPDPPLPFGTAAARWYYVLLKGLVTRGHQVTAYAPCPTPKQAEQAAALFPSSHYDLRCFQYPKRGRWRDKWESFLKPYSYPFGADLRADLERTLAEGFDVLHLETHWAGWLGLRYASRSIINVHSLYSVDLADAPYGSWQNALRTQRVFAAEKNILCSYPRITTLSDRLGDNLRSINPAANVRVIPLGFDAELYPFNPVTNQAGTGPIVGLIGSFTWHPTFTAGVRLIEQLWPEIRRRVPNAQLLLVGRGARTTLLPFLPISSEHIIIEEDVPDVFPYFRLLDVMLYAPYLGTGVKIKVLEAFALGIPVISNHEGVEGIPVIDGVHASIAEENQQLIDHCVDWLNGPTRRDKIVLAARQLLEFHHNPNQVLDQWEMVYGEFK